jgi:hypothetical protein
METKIEAEPEKETEIKNETDDSTVSEKAAEIKLKPVTESSFQQLTPAIIVSVSILFASGILSATSFAKSKDMAPQIRNFYYQLPPSGPYMSNLAMPQNPMVMNQNNPNWSGATPPPWVQNRTGQKPIVNNNHNAMMARPSQMMTPPAWVKQPPRMNRPSWARPTPPWVQNGAGQQSNLSNDQKSMMARPPQMMTPPAWANRPPQMNRPNWARPTPPPWVQNGAEQQPNLSNDQKSMMAQQPQMMTPPAWVKQPPQMNRPNWARPTPPWMQNNSEQSSEKK